MAKGEIVLGCLAPHPPHLIYAENPDANEAFAEGGWETLRWGYHRLARKLKSIDYDCIVVLTPHWQTYVGTHFLGVERFQNISVDPIFPNLFRFHHDITVDIEMAEAMSLCISCKGCKRECPAGVDMAALKLEWQYGQNQRHGIPLRERLLADLPRQAPRLSRMAAAVNAAGNSRALRALAERHLGISKHRALPRWAKRPWHDDEIGTWEPDEGPFADIEDTGLHKSSINAVAQEEDARPIIFSTLVQDHLRERHIWPLSHLLSNSKK